MNKPIFPRQPTKIKEPERHHLSEKNIDIGINPQFDGLSLTDFCKALLNEFKDYPPDQIFVEIINNSEAGGQDISFILKELVEKSDYQYEYEYAKYQEYLKKMEDYHKKLIKYRQEMKEYDKWAKQERIKALEKELETLKNEAAN